MTEYFSWLLFFFSIFSLWSVFRNDSWWEKPRRGARATWFFSAVFIITFPQCTTSRTPEKYQVRADCSGFYQTSVEMKKKISDKQPVADIQSEIPE